MANGDAAAAAGYDLVAGTDDQRNGWDEINKSRDYTANVKTQTATDLAGKAPTSHTHTSAQIIDATALSDPGKLVKYGSSGTLSLPNPTSASHPATKSYVDSAVAGAGSNQANGPTDTAYSRSATGSGWYDVWMNSNNQFMRNTSSRRYKKNIKAIAGNVALEKVLQLRAVTYEARDKTVEGTHIGLIAEEVFEVFPEVVPLEGGKPEAVNYQFLVAPLIAAVQEQQRQIDALTKRLEDR